MAERARRRISAVRTSLIMSVGGVLLGLGIGKAGEPPSVEAEQAASKVITINGTNVKDGSLLFKDIKKGQLEKRFFTRTAADARFVKLSGLSAALDGYLKNDLAAGIFAKIGSSYLKDETNGIFAKIGSSYLKDEVNAIFAKADSTYVKAEADAIFAKADSAYVKAEADARFVNGDGQVVTGSQEVAGVAELLFSFAGLVSAEAETTDSGKTATVTVRNLSSGPLTLASNVPASQGGNQGGTVQPGGSLAILIGLLQPATLQIVAGQGDGAGVHTLNFTALSAGGTSVQVVTQGIIGPD
jgi:hypothetical protein